MANVFCSSSGSNTSPYDTWAKAATTFATAIGAASASGDIIAVDATSPPADISADTTWTALNHISIIASTNSGTSTITPTTMGDTDWLGANATFSSTLSGAFKVYVYGITFRVGGTGTDSLTFASSDGSDFVFDSCYFWLSTTSTGARTNFGSTGANSNVELRNCTYRFGAASGQGIGLSGTVSITGGSVSASGTVPAALFIAAGGTGGVIVEGLDVSAMTSKTLVASQSTSSASFWFSRCKLASGMTILATQTPANKSSGKVWLFDCSSDDTHGIFGYHDAFGSCVSDTGVYYTAGAAAQSWQIVTSANCSFATPFVSPWIDAYNAGTSSITPYIEILRDGSATAYTDAQVWGEFSVKDNAGFVLPSLVSDRQALADWVAGTAGSNQATGAGTGSWTGEGGTAWSGKVDSGSAVTPDEAGHIRGRVVVGAASATVYVDPQIRT